MIFPFPGMCRSEQGNELESILQASAISSQLAYDTTEQLKMN
jgi:hypothetical protein